MGLNLGFRDLSPQQRVGGYFASLDDLEGYVRLLSFDVYVCDACAGGRSRWFCVPASSVEGADTREATTLPGS